MPNWVINPALKNWERRQIGEGAPRIRSLPLFQPVRKAEDGKGDYRLYAPASTMKADRDREIILPSAFSRSLKPYLDQNPAFLWGHRWWGGPQDSIGQVFDGKITDQALILGFDYDAEFDPNAALIWQKVMKGSIRGFSVGFLMSRWVTRNSPKEYVDSLPAYARQALESEAVYLVHTEVTILETSQVPIPSNPDSLTDPSQFSTAGSSRTFQIPYTHGKDATQMDPVSKALADVAQVQNQVKSLETNQQQMTGAMQALCASVAAIGESVKTLAAKPATTEPEKKGISFADLSQEDQDAIISQVTKAVVAQVKGA